MNLILLEKYILKTLLPIKHENPSILVQKIEISQKKLEPHRITYYLYDLATLFHSYWNLGIKNEDYRFIINNKVSEESRLVLLKSLAIVIRNGMSIIGVNTPKIM